MDGKDKMSRPEHMNEPQEVSMLNRERLSMSGIKEVESFDERQIRLQTAQGPCVIEGEQLNIQQLSLDTGKLMVTGLISLINYNVKGAKGKGFIGRIFK